MKSTQQIMIEAVETAIQEAFQPGAQPGEDGVSEFLKDVIAGHVDGLRVAVGVFCGPGNHDELVVAILETSLDQFKAYVRGTQ
jgi:hypothetical protein